MLTLHLIVINQVSVLWIRKRRKKDSFKKLLKQGKFNESKHGHLFDSELHKKKLERDEKKKTKKVDKPYKGTTPSSKNKVVPPIKLKLPKETNKPTEHRRSHEVATSSSNNHVTTNSDKTKPKRKIDDETCNRISDTSSVKAALDKKSISQPASKITLKTVETLKSKNFGKTSPTSLPFTNETMSKHSVPESFANVGGTYPDYQSNNNYTTIHTSSLARLITSKDLTKSQKVETSHLTDGNATSKSSIKPQKPSEVDKSKPRFKRKNFNIMPFKLELNRVPIATLYKYNVPESQIKLLMSTSKDDKSKKDISSPSNQYSKREGHNDALTEVRRSPEKKGDKTESTAVLDPLKTQRTNIDESDSFGKISNHKTCSIREKKCLDERKETITKSSEKKRKLSDHRLSCEYDPWASEDNLKRKVSCYNTEMHLEPSLKKNKEVDSDMKQFIPKKIKSNASDHNTEKSSDFNKKVHEELKCIKDKDETVSLGNSLKSFNTVSEIKFHSNGKNFPDILKRKSWLNDVEVNLETSSKKKECLRTDDIIVNSNNEHNNGLNLDIRCTNEIFNNVECHIKSPTVPAGSGLVIEQVSSLSLDVQDNFKTNNVSDSYKLPSSYKDPHKDKRTESLENVTCIVNEHLPEESHLTETSFSSTSNSTIGFICSYRSLSTCSKVLIKEILKPRSSIEPFTDQENSPVVPNEVLGNAVTFDDTELSPSEDVHSSDLSSNVLHNESNESASPSNEINQKNDYHPSNRIDTTIHLNIIPSTKNDCVQPNCTTNTSLSLSNQQCETNNNNTLSKASTESDSLPSSNQSDDIVCDPRVKRLTYCGYDTASLINTADGLGRRRSSTDIVLATKRFLAMDLKLPKFDKCECFKCKEVFTVYDRWRGHFRSSTECTFDRVTWSL